MPAIATSVIVYVALLLACCTFAFVRGDWPERYSAWVNLLASVLSWTAAVALPAHRWEGAMALTWAIDALACLAFLVLMLTSKRLWLIPCFGFAAAGATSHLARIFQLHLSPLVYYVTEARWAYLNLALLAIGTWRHPRRRTIAPS